MGYLEGLLTGYMDRHHEIQKDSMEKAHDAMLTQGKIYQQLLQSPDPKIKSLAAAGIIELGNPQRRKGGLSGWMGEVEQSASYPRLMDYIRNLPETEQATALAPTTPTGGAIPAPTTTPGGPGSAALPATSATTGGPVPTPTPSPAGNGVPQEPGPLGVLPGTPTPAPQAPEAPAPSFGELTPQQIPFAARGFAGGAQAPVPPYLNRATPNIAARMGEPTPGPATPNFVTPPQPTGGPQVGAQPGPVPAETPPGAQPGAQPMPPAGPPIVAPPAPPAPPPVTEGPGATPAPGGPPTTTAQRLASPPPRPPRNFTRADVFPSLADLKAEQESADVSGNVRGWQDAFRLAGYPDWQERGIQAMLSQKMRGGAGLKEGNVRQLPDGSYVQDLYDPNTGEVVKSIPSMGPIGSGSPGTREAIAFKLYGRQGEDPKATIHRINQPQMARVLEEENYQKAAGAAEIALARARAMQNAPLSAQATSALTETLATKWRTAQAPIREMSRSLTSMQVGLSRFRNGDRVGGAEDIRVAFERILDPTSVVREGEYNRQALGLGLLQRAEGWYQALKLGGGNIPEPQLAAMVETARQLVEAMGGVNEQERQRIEDRATQNGIDPGYIFGGGVSAPPPPPPAAGGPAIAAPTTPAPGGATAAPGVPKPGAITLDTPLVVDANGRLVVKQ